MSNKDYTAALLTEIRRFREASGRHRARENSLVELLRESRDCVSNELSQIQIDFRGKEGELRYLEDLLRKIDTALEESK